jgi:hypothetical protein
MPRRKAGDAPVQRIVVPQLVPEPEPTIAELARQLRVVTDSLKNSDGEIALAKADARAARKAAEASSLKSQLQIAEVEAEAQSAKRTAPSPAGSARCG